MSYHAFPALLAAIAIAFLGSPLLMPEAAADSPNPGSPMAGAWVGIVLGDADSRPGVDVDTVLRRSPAYIAGIEDGDRVLSVNDRDVRTPGKLETILGGQPAGRTIRLGIERDGDASEVEVQLAQAVSSSKVLQMHNEGYKPPTLSLTDLDGEDLDLQSVADKPVVLEFWATWCTVCRQVSRKLEEAVDDSPDAFKVVSITSEEPSVVREHLQTQPKAHDIAIDVDELAHKGFLVNSYPFVAVIGTDGKIETVVSDLNKVDDLIEDLTQASDDE